MTVIVSGYKKGFETVKIRQEENENVSPDKKQAVRDVYEKADLLKKENEKGVLIQIEEAALFLQAFNEICHDY